MIFDIANERGKGRTQAALIRRQLVLARSFRRKIRALLDHQWQVIANHVEQGIFDADHVIDSLRGLMIKAMSEQYTRVGSVFFADVEVAFVDLKSIPSPKEHKGMAEEFWRAFHNWTLRHAANKVKHINDATKKIIRRVIRRETDAGGSYTEIAKAIRARAKDMNLKRALRIARTEVHAASTYSVDEAVRSTRVPFEREWVSILDERTRPEPGSDSRWNHREANGQRRSMNDPFDVSGEKLRFPGDPRGSAGNIIH